MVLISTHRKALRTILTEVCNSTRKYITLLGVEDFNDRQMELLIDTKEICPEALIDLGMRISGFVDTYYFDVFIGDNSITIDISKRSIARKYPYYY